MIKMSSSSEMSSSFWFYIHSTAAHYPETSPSAVQKAGIVELINGATKTFPPIIYDKKQILLSTIIKTMPMPIPTEGRKELSEWLCLMHNQVNKQLEKPLLFDCKIKELDKRYHSDANAVFPPNGLFVPIPSATNPKVAKKVQQPQEGDCSFGHVREWIQGNETTMTTGSMTLMFFISHSCHICHDVAIKFNVLYKEYRHRGLNVVAFHSSVRVIFSSSILLQNFH